MAFVEARLEPDASTRGPGEGPLQTTPAHHNVPATARQPVRIFRTQCHAPSTSLQFSATRLWATRPSSPSKLSSELEILVLSCLARHADAQACPAAATHIAHPPDPTDRDRATGGMGAVFASDTSTNNRQLRQFTATCQPARSFPPTVCMRCLTAVSQVLALLG